MHFVFFPENFTNFTQKLFFAAHEEIVDENETVKEK